MGQLWQGSLTTQVRIATGLILFGYVLLHYLAIGSALISPDLPEILQDGTSLVIRTTLGTVVLYGALLTHAALSIGKATQISRSRLRITDVVQIGFGVTIPFLLAVHLVFTRGAAEQFALNDSLSYIVALIWGNSSGWQQAALLLIVWVHGCVGLHMWLRISPMWERALPFAAGGATLVPAFALAGFMTEGRRVAQIMSGADEETRLEFFDEVNWLGPAEFEALVRQTDLAEMALWGLLGVCIVIFVLRRVLRVGRRISVSYVDGPKVRSRPGATLLEISQNAGVPHMSLCGGKGRCTTCRVIVTEGMSDLVPPSEAEVKALKAAKAPPNARLACQMRPKRDLSVYKVFRSDGTQDRAHASQGQEAQLALLFLDMRGFTMRTEGQLPYDVVFLLNRFFDAVVPAIQSAGGTIDKYMGDGLLAVFEAKSAAASAHAGLSALEKIEAALAAFNAELTDEGAALVQIGIGLHLGNLVIGELGAKTSSSRTLIGDTVNTASRLEGQTKDLRALALISRPVLEAAGLETETAPFVDLELRGLVKPLEALAIPYETSVRTILDARAPR